MRCRVRCRPTTLGKSGSGGRHYETEREKENRCLPEQRSIGTPHGAVLPNCYYHLSSRSVSRCQSRGGLDLSRVAQIQHARKPTYARPRPRAIRNINL
jgi:hypothetical protein